mmetsp:Transcript_31205/g.67027  ORF Transcript_31205/g.67027 Transcript_31205/m.67027 type:complete len:491 (-) Transcript_31205:703-2175(-)
MVHAAHRVLGGRLVHQAGRVRGAAAPGARLQHHQVHQHLAQDQDPCRLLPDRARPPRRLRRALSQGVRHLHRHVRLAPIRLDQFRRARPVLELGLRQPHAAHRPLPLRSHGRRFGLGPRFAHLAAHQGARATRRVQGAAVEEGPPRLAQLGAAHLLILRHPRLRGHLPLLAVREVRFQRDGHAHHRAALPARGPFRRVRHAGTQTYPERRVYPAGSVANRDARLVHPLALPLLQADQAQHDNPARQGHRLPSQGVHHRHLLVGGRLPRLPPHRRWLPAAHPQLLPAPLRRPDHGAHVHGAADDHHTVQEERSQLAGPDDALRAYVRVHLRARPQDLPGNLRLQLRGIDRGRHNHRHRHHGLHQCGPDRLHYAWRHLWRLRRLRWRLRLAGLQGAGAAQHPAPYEQADPRAHPRQGAEVALLPLAHLEFRPGSSCHHQAAAAAAATRREGVPRRGRPRRDRKPRELHRGLAERAHLPLQGLLLFAQLPEGV